MRRLIPLLVAAVVVIALPAGAQEKKSRRMTADAVKLKGLELKKILDVDVDGLPDGRKELVGAALGPKGLQLVIIGENAEGAVVTEVLPPAGGKEIAKLEALQIAPPKDSFEVVFEVYDETPDEKVKRVRVYGHKDGRLKEIFTSVLHRSKNAAERDEWERDKSIVAYGDARGGWYFSDLEDDGVGEVLVRRKPQILRIANDAGEEVKLMTGVREQVWRWDEANFAFKDTGERLNDFLPSLEITKVTASSAWIEPAVLKELKANALNDALNKSDSTAAAVPKDGKEGAMGGDLELGLEDLDAPSTTKPKPKGGGKKAAKSKEPEPPPEPEIEIDRSKFMAFGADKNLATAWIEDDEKTDGKGQWIEVELEEETPVRMVRVVAGCVDTNQSFRSHNIPESFLVQLDGGSEARIDRRDPGKFDNPAIAFSDALFKSKERPWMKTTLVFYEGKAAAKKVRVTLDKAIKNGRANQTCISEVSVH
jgi:hypothetical protein